MERTWGKQKRVNQSELVGSNTGCLCARLGCVVNNYCRVSRLIIKDKTTVIEQVYFEDSYIHTEDGQT